jgi:membrane associated rhomboid family serine protease
MIPVGDSPQSRTVPVVTWALIAANILAFMYTIGLSAELPSSRVAAERAYEEQVATLCSGFPQVRPTDRDAFYCRWSYQPREWFGAVEGDATRFGQDRLEVLFSIVSSVFIHAGWLHILGNMLFLWVFGDNVEDRLGHLRFLVFYLLAGAAASLVQGAVDTSSLVPTVGASGAVAGVLGAYVVYFPKARVTAILPIFPLVLPLSIPAIVMIGLWFVQNLLSGLATVGSAGTPDSGVAFFAHVGGLVFGAAVTLLVIRPLQRARRR